MFSFCLALDQNVNASLCMGLYGLSEALPYLYMYMYTMYVPEFEGESQRHRFIHSVGCLALVP